MLYFVCHFCEGGDDFWITPCKEPDDVKEYIKAMDLGPEDYSIIKGTMLKSMENKSFDLKNFKGD
jgi:hypothetical protein